MEDPDRERASVALERLDGVEAVLDRSTAARKFELPADRIGDLLVLADAATALGKSERDHDLSMLGGTLRSHGGIHEQEIPLIVCEPVRQELAGRRDLRNADLFDLLLNGTHKKR